MSALLWHGRGASRLPADIALALIPSLPRSHLERLVQQLIDRMDEADGDSDCEPEETDHSGGEDDYSRTLHDGPGCVVADGDFGIDDQPHDGEDQSRAFDYGDDQTVIPLWQMNP